MESFSDQPLAGHSAIVTGASSGIGEATARYLADAGASVALAARRVERLEALQDDIESSGGTAIVVETDVTDRDQVQALADETQSEFGGIDILINNAGLMPLSYMKNLHEEEWERMVDVNLKGVLYNIGAVLPVMTEQESGHIVNISSVAGRRVMPGGAVYSATKFGVRALSEGMRNELGPQGIRVISVEPGAVDTELPETITDEELMDDMEGLMSGFEILESEDIAQKILEAVASPQRVDVEEIVIMPSGQAT
ncbi:MAG: oxidoreductase [Bacteroidetes bacterium QS_9_68_14]|nr:MAG: oxidoreductase [Bacteroidetes bacterium QS_9_68_14]